MGLGLNDQLRVPLKGIVLHLNPLSGQQGSQSRNGGEGTRETPSCSVHLYLRLRTAMTCLRRKIYGATHQPIAPKMLSTKDARCTPQLPGVWRTIAKDCGLVARPRSKQLPYGPWPGSIWLRRLWEST